MPNTNIGKIVNVLYRRSRLPDSANTADKIPPVLPDRPGIFMQNARLPGKAGRAIYVIW